MQQIFKPAVGCTDGFLPCSSGIMGLTRVLEGILFLALFHNPIQAFSAAPPPATYSMTMAWNGSPDPAVAGYFINYGAASGDYTNSIAVGNVTTTIVPGLVGGVTYYFAVSAFDADGLESALSNEITYAPGIPTISFQVSATGQVVLSMSGLIGHTYNIEATEDLVTWTVIGTVTVGPGGPSEFTDPDAAGYPNRFYRTQDTQP
jgi:hypothetical protein